MPRPSFFGTAHFHAARRVCRVCAILVTATIRWYYLKPTGRFNRDGWVN
jgi:hypothetical protein